jgi:Mg-chelatase subunit ChlD
VLLWIAIALGLGCALSICVRSGPVSARAANVLALLAVAAAAIVPPIAERVLRSAHVAIVTTGEASAELRAQSDQLRSGFLPMPDVAFVQSTGDLDAAIARAALAAGPRLMDTLVVWNAPFAPSAHAPQSPLAGASALVAAPLAFSPDSLRMEFASAPREARPLAAEVRVASTDPLRADLAVAGDGWDAKASVGLGAGGLGLIAALPTKTGSAQVEVAVDSGGRRVSWNGAFEVLAAPVALLIAPPGPLAAALRAQGVKTEEADALPEDLSRYCAVVLGSALPAAAQQRLQRAIDDGIGVFAFGDGLQRDGDPLRDALPIRVLPRNEGNAGDGGEGDGPAMPTPANPNAPKQPDKDPPQPEKPNEDLRAEDPIVSPKEPMEVDKHTIAMVLVIDRSGSMGLRVAGGETKMSYAKTSARETARALGEGDEVGLVTFGDDDLARVEMALTDAAQFARIEQGIARLAHANERTFLDSGLLLARAMLGKSKASVRHVVVLSDGEVWDQELVLRQRANAMRKEGLTLSMISIVDDRTLATFQGMAERLAREGGGSFLPVRDPRFVPKLVSAEVVRALDRVGRKPNGVGNDPTAPPKEDLPKPKPPEPKEPEKPKEPERKEPEVDPAKDAPLAIRAVATSPALEPIPAEWPPLRSAIAAAARASSHVLLVAGAEGRPVLAFGNLGLGRVGAFCADLAGEAASAFRADPDFPARFAQWVVSVQRAETGRAAATFGLATITPPAPTPREVDALRTLCGAEPVPVADLALPPPIASVQMRSLVPDWALAAILALLSLACVERLAARRAG